MPRPSPLRASPTHGVWSQSANKRQDQLGIPYTVEAAMR
jgi:hypothetical protein